MKERKSFWKMKTIISLKTNVEFFIILLIPLLIWIYLSSQIFQQCLQLATIQNEWSKIEAVVYQAEQPSFGPLQSKGNTSERSSKIQVTQNLKISYYYPETHYIGQENYTYTFVQTGLPNNVTTEEVNNRIQNEIFHIKDTIHIFVNPQNNAEYYVCNEIFAQGRYTKTTAFITFLVSIIIGIIIECIIAEIWIIKHVKKGK